MSRSYSSYDCNIWFQYFGQIRNLPFCAHSHLKYSTIQRKLIYIGQRKRQSIFIVFIPITCKRIPNCFCKNKLEHLFCCCFTNTTRYSDKSCIFVFDITVVIYQFHQTIIVSVWHNQKFICFSVTIFRNKVSDTKFSALFESLFGKHTTIIILSFDSYKNTIRLCLTTINSN